MQRKLPDIIAKHKLATIIIIGILVRVLLIPITAHPYDVYAWYSLSHEFLAKPEFNLFNFPPLWYTYTLAPLGFLYDSLSKIIPTGAIPMASLPPELNFFPGWGVELVPGAIFNTIAKFPFLVSDILMTLLLYKIVQELTKNNSLAEKAAFLWFLNPFVIWISAGWGMWDSMPALLSLASLFFLLKKKITLSAITLSLGVASKLYPVLFILPISIYILKAPAFSDLRRKALVKFILVFSAVSLLLFLPYIGLIANFFTNFFGSSPGSGVLDNPFANPVGFGLTYWSVTLLNRLFHLQVSPTLISIAQVASIVLLALSLALVYWKITKFTFQKPTFDLAVAMLLPVLALFLSYRIIPEQWFIWAIPFIIIVCVQGEVKASIFWTASFSALLYSILNCPLPFFLLPLSPWHSGALVKMVYSYWAMETYAFYFLAIMGSLFSILMILIFFRLLSSKVKWIREKNS